MSEALLQLQIANERDIIVARQRAREASGLLGFEPQDQVRIATAVSEIARNALQYAGGGTVDFAVDLQSPHPSLQVSVHDHGAGIEDVDAAAIRARDNGEPRMGLVSARRMMDDFQVESRRGTGTTVRMGKALPRRMSGLRPARITQIARELSKHRANDAYAETQEQNRELLRCMEELRLRQEELSRLNAELEDTNRGVMALYSELDERAAHLRLADEAKTRFFSNMSHEFRTPVNSILALSRLLLDRVDGDLSPEQLKQVGYIRQAAEQLGTLVDDLLDLRKAEAGKITLRIESFTALDLFGALRGMFKPMMTSDDVALIFEDPPDMPPLHTDQGKLAQILRNLISNALKFTERGSVRVSASYSASGNTVAFSVADTGIGIAPEHHRGIFEEFTQVESSLQTTVKGTGLGLPLSQRLAILLGGHIELQSAVGQGSTFSLLVPATLATSQPDEQSADESQPRTLERVLIIDDNEIERYTLRQYLAPGNFEVIESAGGYDGLRLARQRRPDFIFLDLVMPDIHGFALLNLLQASEETRSLPVIIFTSQRLERVDRERLAAARAVLSKQDLSRESVAKVLREVRQSNEVSHESTA